MTLAVVLILAVLWAVVLGPPLVRRVMERRSTESIDSFHHSLHLLERTGPKIIQPAYRLGVATAGAAPPVDANPGTGRPNLVLLKAVDPASGGAAVVDETSGECYERLGVPPDVVEAERARPSLAERAGEYRRQRNRRRRRDIVVGLGGTALITGLAGIAHGLHALWILTGICAVTLLAYAALFHYARRLAQHGQHRPETERPRRRRPAPRPEWDEVYQEAPLPADVRARQAAAAAGFPGAWDDFDEPLELTAEWDNLGAGSVPARPTVPARTAGPDYTDVPDHANVVAMTPGFVEPFDETEEEVEERYGVLLYRDRAAGAR